MINQIKFMRRAETSKQVLDRTEFFQDIKKSEGYKSFLGLNNEFKAYERLEIIGCKIAIKKVKTVEDIELCARWVEESNIGLVDTDEWAEQIRIKVYGIEWYLKRQFNSPSYQEFIDFTNEMGIKNPF